MASETFEVAPESDAAAVAAESAPRAVVRSPWMGPLTRALSAVLARDWLVLGGLLVVAGITRLPGLAQRAEFDGDQGHDMLTLLRFAREGVFPLLGPPTSIGDFHHGAFYYLLLAPVAALENSDPVAVVTAIAVMGILAVAVTWWLARSMGGRLAGLIAGAILALSPAAIDESTFLWNPNPIPLFAAIALASAWRARQTRHARWWVPALLGSGIVFQLHVLGVVFLPPILALLVIEWRRARRRDDRWLARWIVWAGLAGMALVALLFVPLLVHELQNNWSEVHNALVYFTSSAPAPGQLALPARLVFTLFRIVGWPLVGLVTSAPAGAALGLALVATLGIWAAISAEGERRFAIRWLLGTVAWSAIALAVLAPSLQTVVAGLPNDHYHAFLDPVVVTLLAVSTVAIAAPAGNSRLANRPAQVTLALRAGLTVAIAVVVAIGISRWPAPADPNGGWPAAQAAGQRIVAITAQSPVSLADVPDFKTPDGIGFPIAYAGGQLDPDWTGSYFVVPCDRLFESVVGAPCGGPAEDARIAAIAASESSAPATLVTRFDASPRTSVSIYRIP
jgi:4-amino-4-deoxy-L-arabinose transferase-like glycosyltransferase